MKGLVLKNGGRTNDESSTPLNGSSSSREKHSYVYFVKRYYADLRDNKKIRHRTLALLAAFFVPYVILVGILVFGRPDYSSPYDKTPVLTDPDSTDEIVENIFQHTFHDPPGRRLWQLLYSWLQLLGFYVFVVKATSLVGALAGLGDAVRGLDGESVVIKGGFYLKSFATILVAGYPTTFLVGLFLGSIRGRDILLRLSEESLFRGMPDFGMQVSAFVLLSVQLGILTIAAFLGFIVPMTITERSIRRLSAKFAAAKDHSKKMPKMITVSVGAAFEGREPTSASQMITVYNPFWLIRGLIRGLILLAGFIIFTGGHFLGPRVFRLAERFIDVFSGNLVIVGLCLAVLTIAVGGLVVGLLVSRLCSYLLRKASYTANLLENLESENASNRVLEAVA